MILNLTDTIQYNIVPSSFWFKEQILFAITEVSTIPIQDVYITKIEFINDSSDFSNLLEIIVDTQYDSASDVQFLFFETTFMDALNNKLLETTHYFWSIYKLDVIEAFSKSTPNVCYPITDTSVDYSYYENADDNQVKINIIPSITYPITILYYYGYSAFNAVTGTLFDGAVTRYCKTKYYEAIFKNYTTTSYVQYFPTTINKWSDVHLRIVIENMDPRGANMNVRYALARAFTRLIGHTESYDANKVLEYFDVNIFMIQGEQPDETQDQVFKNTAFYTELRFRNNEQKNIFLELFKNRVLETYNVEGNIKEKFSEGLLKFLKDNVGKKFKIDYKNVNIYILH
ncbi:hypothetical protein WA158_005988 [Blastocystis sp. Blastoise]